MRMMKIWMMKTSDQINTHLQLNLYLRIPAKRVLLKSTNSCLQSFVWKACEYFLDPSCTQRSNLISSLECSNIPRMSFDWVLLDVHAISEATAIAAIVMSAASHRPSLSCPHHVENDTCNIFQPHLTFLEPWYPAVSTTVSTVLGAKLCEFDNTFRREILTIMMECFVMVPFGGYLC
jgi:hypothetical protein